MRVAFVATTDFTSIREFSGTAAFMARTLSRLELTLDPVVVPFPWDLVHWVRSRISWRLARKYIWKEYDRRLLRRLAGEIAGRLRKIQPDWVFSYSSIPVAYLETDAPIAFWSDAVFDAMVGYYPEYDGLSRASLRNGHLQEQEALSRCRLAIYSSQWAAESAKRYYQIDASKVHVVPYGANLEKGPDRQEVTTSIQARRQSPLQLLFIGGQWSRKGGDLAVAVAQHLSDAGEKVVLNVVGCEPPQHTPGFVKHHGFMRKDDPNDLERLWGLFGSSHFLLLPSRAECCAVVLAEACAFGVPCLASKVGGNGTLVKPGVNGYLLELSSFADEASRLILELVGNFNGYRELALQAYQEYRQRLNWDVAALQVKALLEQ